MEGAPSFFYKVGIADEKDNSIFFIFTLVLLSGCNENEKLSNPVFNWDGNNYFVTNEPINKIELEEKIGKLYYKQKITH